MSLKIRNFYLRDIRRQVGASPIWPISARYHLGDFGYYNRRTGHFSVRGNIFENLEVPRQGVIEPPSTPPVLLYKLVNSSNTTRNEFSVNADAAPWTGKLELAFEGDRSYVFQLFRARVTYLKFNELLRSKLAGAVAKGKWDYRYRIVEMVYDSPGTRFSFSLSRTASISLAGDVEINEIPAKGNVDFSIQSSSNMDGSFWIEGAPSTPFVKFVSFKRRELRFIDEKLLVGTDWYLEADDTSSFDDELTTP